MRFPSKYKSGANSGRQTTQSACPPAKRRVKIKRIDGIVGNFFGNRERMLAVFCIRTKARQNYVLAKNALTFSSMPASLQSPNKRCTYSSVSVSGDTPRALAMRACFTNTSSASASVAYLESTPSALAYLPLAIKQSISSDKITSDSRKASADAKKRSARANFFSDANSNPTVYK